MNKGYSFLRLNLYSILGTTSLVLVLGTFGVFTFYAKDIESDAIARIQQTAQLAMSTIYPAVLFSDPEVCENVLETLNKRADVDGARVFLPSGEIFAEVGRPFPVQTGAQRQLLNTKTHWILHEPVLHNDQFIGWFSLSTSKQGVQDKRKKALFGFGSIIFLLILLTVIMTLTIQKRLSASVDGVVHFANQVAHQGQYNLRYEGQGPIELRPIGEAINHLLQKFQERGEERDQAELDLKKSEARFLRLAKKVKDVVFEWDFRNQRLDYISPSVSSLVSQTPETVILKQKWPSIFPQNWLELVKLIQSKPGEGVTERKYSKVFNGQIYWLQLRCFPLYSEADELVSIEGLLSDVTYSENIERERELLIGDLKAKNDELQQFSYTVSHDLKSPLITIRGFLGFLTKNAKAGNFEALEKDVGRIERAATKMHDLLEDLLQLSRVGRLRNEFKVVSFLSIIDEALELVSGRLIDKEMKFVKPDRGPLIRCDQGRLVQVFQNLLENSIKYMGDQKHPKIEIGYKLHGSQATFFVKDNGQGFDPVYAEKIFRIFEKLDPKSEGTGIGLALVKRIVELHAGKIWAESDGIGEGSTFSVFLPIEEEGS